MKIQDFFSGFTNSQIVFLIIGTMLLIPTIYGLFKRKAFNFSGKIDNLNLRARGWSYPKYFEDNFWFVSIGFSRFRFWLITFFNFFIIIFCFLIGLGVFYFK